MRHAFIALAVLTGSALSTTAFALNPQPLPPGVRGPTGGPNATAYEPPDPCRAYRGAAYGRCHAAHEHKPATDHANSSATGGGGAGKAPGNP